MAGCGRTLFVAGGSGFIGSYICKEGVRVGFNVISLSRSGRPNYLKEQWADGVEWVRADVMKTKDYVQYLREADAIVSCIGKFGVGVSNEVYESNADTNIHLAQLAHRECGNISKFGYISAQEYSMAFQKPFRSYYASKQRVEKIVQSLFPKHYLILRPNWVFGWRRVWPGFWLPTQALGAPLEHIMQPLADYCCHTKWVVPPTPVEELAHVMVLGCTVGQDVSGMLPTVRVRDVMEREAQGRPLNDFLKPQLHEMMKQRREYLEQTSFVEKYGKKNYGRKGMEMHLMSARTSLNPAMTRPEFMDPIKGPAYLMDAYVSPEYRVLQLVEREQHYLEGREKQKLFEARKQQELLDGERRLLGEKVDRLPVLEHVPERDPALPRNDSNMSARLLQASKPADATPDDFEWSERNRTKTSMSYN